MHSARFVPFVLALPFVFAACAEDATTPLPALWLEWGGSVGAGAPFGVRTFVETYSPADLRIRIRVVGDTLTIEPHQRLLSCPIGCGDAAPTGYDTLVWVPPLAATSPRTIVLRAPFADSASPPPWPVRTFGTLTVLPAAPAGSLRHAAGRGRGFQGSPGCYFIRNPSLQLYVSSDPAPAWAPEFTGFVYGRIDPFQLSVCLDGADVIQVDSIK